MKILACAGAEGNEAALSMLTGLAARRKPDMVLFAGGIMSRDIGKAHREDYLGLFFKTIASVGATVAAIPGPGDAPLAKFLRAALNSEIVYPNVFIVHATPYQVSDVAVSGLGGLLTEEEDAGEPEIKYSHATSEYFLRSLWRLKEPEKMLLLSEPPPGKFAGDSGNNIVNEFILSYRPRLCVVAGNKAHRGSEYSARTLLVNPGKINEGSAAFIDSITREVEMLDFKAGG